VTGVIFGFGVCWFLLPHLEEALRKPWGSFGEALR
jgi:hypothetical protein